MNKSIEYMYKDWMWCVLGLTWPHVADAKGGHGKEITKKANKKNIKEYWVQVQLGQSLAKNISLEEEIEILAAS